MFPLPLMIPAGVAQFLALHWTLQGLHQGKGPLTLSWRMALGALGVILFSLLLRIYDELKDAEADLRLGRAGDPLYADRPLVTGAVLLDDVRAMRWWVSGLLVAIHVPLCVPLGVHPLAAFLGTFFLTWLSFKWFFLPAISKNVLLAFLSHNPLSVVLAAYVVSIYLAEFPRAVETLSPWTAALLVGLWMPIAAWEVGRKVRLPEEETDYDTYSKRLGWRTAAALPGVFVAISAACLGGVLWALELTWALPFLALGAAVPVGASLLLEVAPTPARTRLRPATELYLLIVTAGLAAVLGFQYGVSVGGPA